MCRFRDGARVQDLPGYMGEWALGHAHVTAKDLQALVTFATQLQARQPTLKRSPSLSIPP